MDRRYFELNLLSVLYADSSLLGMCFACVVWMEWIVGGLLVCTACWQYKEIERGI
jgi:hypothetical protein